MYLINSKPVKTIYICDLGRELLDAASRVYAQGLLMEKPPGSKESLENLVQIMRHHLQTYLLRESTRRIWLGLIGNQPRGLLDFYLQPRTIRIRFLCAIPPGQGVGTQIMVHLAQFAQNNGLKKIHTTVSSLDRRAMNFYFHHLGFLKTGKSTEEPDFDLFLASIDPQEILRRYCQPSSIGK
jgi:hypothetical protein